MKRKSSSIGVMPQSEDAMNRDTIGGIIDVIIFFMIMNYLSYLVIRGNGLEQGVGNRKRGFWEWGTTWGYSAHISAEFQKNGEEINRRDGMGFRGFYFYMLRMRPKRVIES